MTGTFVRISTMKMPHTPTLSSILTTTRSGFLRHASVGRMNLLSAETVHNSPELSICSEPFRKSSPSINFGKLSPLSAQREQTAAGFQTKVLDGNIYASEALFWRASVHLQSRRGFQNSALSDCTKRFAGFLKKQLMKAQPCELIWMMRAAAI